MNMGSAKTAIEPINDELDFDPLVSTVMSFRYDIELGYRRHHLTCMDGAQRTELGELDGLSRRGFTHMPVVSAATSDELAARFRGAGNVLGAKDLGRERVEMLFDEMFSGPLGASIRRFFCCSYGVLFVDFGVSKPLTDKNPNSPDNASFKWHCDVSPTPYVKLLVYLTGRDEHDGATDFIDLATTAQFHRVGYAMCPVSKRLSDLSRLAERHGIDFAPERLYPEKGEAAVFSPAQVLHMGIPPSHGERILMSIGVIPAPLEWRDFLATNYGYMCNARLGEFPQVA